MFHSFSPISILSPLSNFPPFLPSILFFSFSFALYIDCHIVSCCLLIYLPISVSVSPLTLSMSLSLCFSLFLSLSLSLSQSFWIYYGEMGCLGLLLRYLSPFSELRTLFYFRNYEPFFIFGITNPFFIFGNTILQHYEPFFLFGIMNLRINEPSDKRTFGKMSAPILFYL